MPSVAWYYRSAGSPVSGELRRLGLPALLIEQKGWTSDFRSAVEGEATDIAVVPAAAIDLLPQIDDGGNQAIILLDLDDETVQRGTQLLDKIHLAAGRIDAVVARGSVAFRWTADNLAGEVSSIYIPDVADREAELRATALRFEVPRAKARPGGAVPPRLWFAEPGDLVSTEEAAFVLDAAAREPGLRVVAPQAVLDWLELAGLPGETGREIWSPGCLEALLRRGVHFELPVLDTALRRHAKLARYGMAAAAISEDALKPYQPVAVAQAWEGLLQAQLSHSRPAPLRPVHTLLVFLDLIQDLELALPIIDAARAGGNFRLRIAITSWLLEKNPRVRRELDARDIAPEVYDRQLLFKGFGLSLEGVDALLTIVETTLNVHKRSHLLTLRAQALGIPTFTLQHGLENVGLTYFDSQPAPMVDILSDYIFVWFPADDVPALVPERVRPRLIHVGRPRMTTRKEKSPLPVADDKRVIAVFENLHWDRYSANFREAFMADCFALAGALDDTVLVLKPHPAGQWSSKIRDEIADWPANVILADLFSPEWAKISTPSLIASADAVITTPSSIAVDAAFQGKRVAVAGYDLDISLYAPLPLLRSFDDWLSFASSFQSPIQVAQAGARFLSRMNVSGPSEERIAAAISAVLAKRLRKTP